LHDLFECIDQSKLVFKTYLHDYILITLLMRMIYIRVENS
jgi:hypothetical protein